MSEPVQPRQQEGIIVDPRLLERALKRMRAFVNGNGLDPEKVLLDEKHEVFQYRFPAKVEVKLVPKYGIRTEPGKNTLAELAVSLEDFQKKIQSAVTDVVNRPEKRQKVVDFIFSRSDKGFGIDPQNVTFRDLAFDLVRHEQCQTCSHSGKIPCVNCQGRGMVTCARCRGSRAMRCPKCGGSAYIQGAKGQVSCQYCEGRGKVPCSLCHAKGMMKCPKCAATGTAPCDKCSGTGWLSHLAHIEIEGQIRFSFDRDKVPERLALLIENRGPFLASRGDIEVHLASRETAKPPISSKVATDLSSEKVKDSSADLQEIIVIEYDASCPFGPVSFHVAEKEVPAILLGWQARLIEAPAFLEEMTKVGMQAIEVAATKGGNTVSLLRKACGFLIWREAISQIILSGNLRKAAETTLNRYPTGLSEEKLRQIILWADQSIRRVTRKARYVGLSAGMFLFSGLLFGYFFKGFRSLFGIENFSGLAGLIFDLSLIPVGTILGVVFSQMAAYFSQRRAFAGIVDEAILQKIPRTGKIFWWSLGLSFLIFVLALGTGSALGQPLPEWVSRLMPA